MNIEEEVKVDVTQLEVECAKASSTYYYYAEELALAKSALDEAKDKLAAKSAERSLFYRKTPPEGLKATEAVFASALDNDTEVQTAKANLTKAQAVVNTLTAATTALSKKGDRLRDLTSLNNSKYFNTMDNTGDMHNRLHQG